MSRALTTYVVHTHVSNSKEQQTLRAPKSAAEVSSFCPPSLTESPPRPQIMALVLWKLSHNKVDRASLAPARGKAPLNLGPCPTHSLGSLKFPAAKARKVTQRGESDAPYALPVWGDGAYTWKEAT